MYEYDVWNAFRYILKYRPLRPFSRPRGTSASTKNDSSPPLMSRVNTHTHSQTHIHTRERLWSAMTIINPGNWRVFARKRYFLLRLVVKSKKTYGGRDVLLTVTNHFSPNSSYVTTDAYLHVFFIFGFAHRFLDFVVLMIVRLHHD